MDSAARELRTEVTIWCVDHLVDPIVQYHRGHGGRGLVMDYWIRSFVGLLLPEEPTDGTDYFLDLADNRALIRREMQYNPLEVYQRMSLALWTNLIGTGRPSRNLERDFFSIATTDAQGGPLAFGWRPVLVSEFPDFGAFGHEDIDDLLFTGFRPRHVDSRLLRASQHTVSVEKGTTAFVQVRVKGGRKPYSFALAGASFAAVNQAGRVTINAPASPSTPQVAVWVIIADASGQSVESHIAIKFTESSQAAP